MAIAPEHQRLLVAVAVVVLSIPAGLLARAIGLGSLARLAGRTSWKFDDAIVASLRGPILIWAFLLGLFSAARLLAPGPDLRGVVDQSLLLGFIVSLTLWAARLGGELIDLARPAASEGATHSAGVLRFATRLVVLGLGALVLLSTLGISVAPVLTTVGIGGIAVALGLQETLSNLFAGMQVTLAGNVRVGDFLKLESGEEGFVDDIQWRTTRVRTLPNNLVLIPNSRLAQSIVTNYDHPSQDLAVLVEVGVHYASDLDQVERVTCAVARTIMTTVEGGVAEFMPFIRFHTFGPSSVDFTVILRARRFGDAFLVKHEFIKALLRAYNAEKITIPFPIRAVNLAQEKAVLQ